MIEDNAKPGSTVGADKLYDTAGFVAGCRERGCTRLVIRMASFDTFLAMLGPRF